MKTPSRRLALSPLLAASLLVPLLAHAAPPKKGKPKPEAPAASAPAEPPPAPAEPAPAPEPPPAASTAAPAEPPAPPVAAEASLSAAPAAAPVDTPPPAAPELPWLHPGLEVGLRVGYGLPFGEQAKGAQLSDTFAGKIAAQLDVGYRLNRRFYVGAYGEYGIGLLGDSFKKACDQKQADCSLRTMRFGVNATFHILTKKRILPWIGLGAGYQIASAKTPDGIRTGEVVDTNAHGFELLNAQLGADIVTDGRFRVGPFAQFSLAQHRKQGYSGESHDVPDKALHQWLTLGIRGAFNL